MATRHCFSRFILTFAVLFGLWLLLSGKFDALHMGWGAFGAGVLAWLSSKRCPTVVFPYVRFFLFIPWHLGQILISNLRVVRLVLKPKLPLQSRMMVYEHGLTNQRAMTLLGCAVSLTPGTLTVDIDDKQMIIHALDEASANDIQNHVMSQRVKGVFRKHQP